MNTSSIDRLWTFLCSLDRFMLFLLVGAIAFSIALVVLLWTRWGHSRSLEKCVLLSFLAHALLTGYAATVQIANFHAAPREQFVRIALVDGPPGAEHGQTDGTDPAASPAAGKNPPLAAIAADQDRAAVKKVANQSAAKKPPVVETVAKPQAARPAAAQRALKQLVATASGTMYPWSVSGWQVAEAAGRYLQDFSTAHAAEVKKVAQSLTSAPPVSAAMPAAPPVPASAAKTAVSPVPANASADNGAAAEPGHGRWGQVPCRRRISCVSRAITSAPHWPVAAVRRPRPPCRPLWDGWPGIKAEDGRWEARRNEAGRETTPDGRSRPNAGADADTGMSGLALLAMLGNGHTHLRGDYRENVRRGLNFLLQSQDAQGCLSGMADRYAAMYCHAIATFALGEAYGMTGERRLEQPLRRAIDYTLAAQDPYGGGWRYKPRDAGDTSQLGWQFMALKSAETAGIPMPETTRQGIIRYLQSVASHTSGGLASYRPLEPPSRTMTAEAMLCWQFLGIARSHPACDEAANYLLSAPPGVGPTNFYYWYYGTFVMHQFQGDGWQRWNTAVATQLVGLQNKEGPLAGSWDPDSVWGGYGGRIYSTALGAMCLEVYYRFLPVYGNKR